MNTIYRDVKTGELITVTRFMPAWVAGKKTAVYEFKRPDGTIGCLLSSKFNAKYERVEAEPKVEVGK